jgi:hypothetical protein
VATGRASIRERDNHYDWETALCRRVVSGKVDKIGGRRLISHLTQMHRDLRAVMLSMYDEVRNGIEKARFKRYAFGIGIAEHVIKASIWRFKELPP